ncbi:MAG: DUF2202 domain-containing protein [Candidatus Gracilibacteria bacterium]|nr:DUF2202 domain-containing protein [Candidatus Gracilibacteria bacterium]
MKTKNVLLAGVATIAVFAIGLNYSYAMNGNGMGNNGQGMGNGQGRSVGNNTQTMGNQNIQNNNIGDLLSNISVQELTESEKQDLLYSYSEESLAHDMYTYFYEKYGVQTFLNIANSETEHKDAVKLLLDRYNLEVPTGYGELDSTFNSLKEEGSVSLQKAFEVGMKIEMLDIDDIPKMIKNTDNDDIKVVLLHIGGASYNHLRGFLKGLSFEGLNTTIDYSEYLTQDELNTRGPLSYKLSDKLETEGIVFSDVVNNAKCTNNQVNTNQSTNTGMGNSSNVNKGQNGSVNSNFNSLKNKYRNTIETKYSKTISNMSLEQSNELISKIDALMVDISTKDYTLTTKQNYNAILSVLKDILNEKIAE